MAVCNNNRQQGDTLIEVLFAISIFALVTVGGMSIMNQGTAMTQRALEISMVRNEIDAQAEALRFINASYIAAYGSGSYTGPAAIWQDISINHTVDKDNVDSLSTSTCTGPNFVSSYDYFIMDAKNASAELLETPGYYSLPDTFARVRYNSTDVFQKSDGMWIQAVKSDTIAAGNEKSAGYIDFHINACWNSIGQEIPVVLSTIVRLYEPRG